MILAALTLALAGDEHEDEPIWDASDWLARADNIVERVMKQA